MHNTWSVVLQAIDVLYFDSKSSSIWQQPLQNPTELAFGLLCLLLDLLDQEILMEMHPSYGPGIQNFRCDLQRRSIVGQHAAIHMSDRRQIFIQRVHPHRCMLIAFVEHHQSNFLTSRNLKQIGSVITSYLCRPPVLLRPSDEPLTTPRIQIPT